MNIDQLLDELYSYSMHGIKLGLENIEKIHVFKMPFLIIRAISDKANHDAKVDFPEFVKLAAKNSKTIIEGILERI